MSIIPQEWVVDRSHMVAVPKTYTTTSLNALKLSIQKTADGKKYRPIIGLLEFTHCIRDGEEMLLAFFRDKNNVKRRFMRLIRKAS